MKMQNQLFVKRSLSEKVLILYVSRFLNPDLDAGNMITVFDIIEHNPNGKSRLHRLMEEKCIAALTPEQIDQAIELLND